VRHTHEVLENLQNLLIASGSTESSYRGFVLTGHKVNMLAHLFKVSKMSSFPPPACTESAEDPANIYAAQMRASNVNAIARTCCTR
jgi:hypothetical protein